MTKSIFKRIYGFIGLFVSIKANAAPSRMDSADLFDSILSMFHNTAHTWSHTITNYASWLFWSLALISMVWTYGFMALQKADIQEFFRETLKFIVTLGFFFWLLINGPLIASSIIESLRELAANASGLNQHVSPSSIVDVGFDIVSKAINNSSIWSPAATIVGLIVAGIILVVLTLVGMNMLIILISAWIVTYAGVFLLGFGGGRWTQEMALNYYRSILGIALQAFAMILIMGIGKSFIDQYYALMSKDILLKEMFIMLAVSIILLILMNKIPPILSGLVSGGGYYGGGGPSGGLGLGSAIGAASLAGATVAAGMGAASAQGAGGLSALNAAFKAASGSMGGDVPVTPMGNSSSSSKLGGLASAMGSAGKFTGSFGSHLMSGVVDVSREKASSMKENFSERVSETTGGKVASAISAKANGSIINEVGGSSDSPNNSTPHMADSTELGSNVQTFSTPGGEISAGDSDVPQPNAKEA